MVLIVKCYCIIVIIRPDFTGKSIFTVCSEKTMFYRYHRFLLSPHHKILETDTHKHEMDDVADPPIFYGNHYRYCGK